MTRKERKKKQKDRRRTPKRIPRSKTTGPTVEEYLKSIGIGDYQDSDVFWKGLENRYGEDAKKLLKGISARREGHSVDVHALRNASFSFGIATAAQFYGRIYREFLSWFLRARFPAPDSILDIGSDIGVTTCFYAHLYPEARILGVDICNSAINYASELAKRLDLQNLDFACCDVATRKNVFSDQYQLVLATVVFHEVLGDFPSQKVFSIRDVSITNTEPTVLEKLRRVTNLMKPGATLISMDRLPDAASHVWWLQLLEEAGLTFDSDRSFLLSHYNVEGELETLPITVATKTAPHTQSTPKEILAFRIYRDIEENEESYTYHDEIAEAFFLGFSSKQLIRGYQAIYKNESGTERIEYWSAGPLVLIYNYTNRAVRRLTIKSNAVLSELLVQADAFREQKSEVADVTKYSPEGASAE